MENPYLNLPCEAFWKTGVVERESPEIANLWRPKFPLLPTEKISTAGSCFAQHISNALQASGFQWFNGEPPPLGLPAEVQKEFGYGVFSFRTGNIYTAAMLEQWVCWARGVSNPPDEVFTKDGRYYDPFRPAIEPNGFRDKEELFASRATTLRSIIRVIKASDVFVFTFGLTEAWCNKSGGFVYPMCPGTLAGEFDPSEHVFKNYDYSEIYKSMQRVMAISLGLNPSLRFLFTVSPVPLTATASGEHVLTATTYSKSVLRAVAGDLAKADTVDYFPSYEMITAPAFRGRFYEPNLRSVTPEGVSFVMSNFFNCLSTSHPESMAQHATSTPRPVIDSALLAIRAQNDLVCEDVLMEAFARTN